MHKFTTIISFCLTGIFLAACSGSASVGYQPPVLPVKISINTNGDVEVSWENSIQTPYGTFSAEVSSNLSDFYPNKNGVLIVSANGVNTVYDLNGQNNIAITLDSGYYRQIELRKDGVNWYFEVIRIQTSPLPTEFTNTSTPSTANLTNTPKPSATYVTILVTPEEFIHSYFSTINARKYQKAWLMLTPSFKQKYNSTGFQPYVDWWKTIQEVRVLSVYMESQEQYSATLSVELSYYYEDGRIDTYDLIKFEIIWDDNTSQWQIDDMDLIEGAR